MKALEKLMPKPMDENITIVKKAIPIFEQKYPDSIGVFAFDNATSHAAYAPDALIVHHMNLNPDGKKKFKNGFKSDGEIQSMHLSDGRPKGIKLVLEEKGLWKKELKRICSECKIHSPTKNDCCAVRILSLQPDFAAQRPLIQEIIEDRGHKIIFYPKFHCELNFIEQFWGAAK
ncbi:unnamed protein product [Rhizophagus irregularis]|nr:unnamed protein product [Rhizophagus irregularis]